MKIAVIGGNGYIGTELIAQLLQHTDHDIVSLSRNAEAAKRTGVRFTASNTDIFDTEQLHQNLMGCDVVYYLVHMMGQSKRNFVEAEAAAATSLVQAVEHTAVRKIIFLGGLGNDSDTLSEHLASRHKTGELLRKSDAQVIEFRASMVIGKGSASYDIVTNLVHKLPILLFPIWAKTLTQPIGLEDTVAYLIAALSTSLNGDHVVEIGGPESMTYESLMQRYAHWKHKPTASIHIPFVPVFVASWWLDVFTPGNHAKVGKVMVESLANPMIVTNRQAYTLFPQVRPKVIEDCFV